MSVFASDIKIDPTLRAQLGGNFSPGTAAQGRINDTYAGANKSFGADARARGVKPGSYAGDRLSASLGLSQQGLSTGLEDILGNTAYKDYGNQRGYDENSRLASEIGALNKPDATQSLLEALGLAGKVGGAIYGAYKPTPRPGQSYGSPLTLGKYSGYSDMASYQPEPDPLYTPWR